MDRWLPATLPAKRLAQYLERLAALFGDADAVHFVKLTKGSARQYLHVEPSVSEAVWNRLSAANDEIPKEAADIRRDINRMLLEDDCTGFLRVDRGPKVIEFPGRKTPISQEVVIHETGDLEGVVIRVGGRGASVPVSIDASGGVFHKCSAPRVVAKRLASHLFEGEIRVTGRGKWLRTAEGAWELQSFEIADFIALDAPSLGKFIGDMQTIAGSLWNDLDDPQAELLKQRAD